MLALQELLVKLESEIAKLVPGSQSFTGPGRFMFDLLGRVGITEATWSLFLHMIETAMTLLADDSLCKGRK